MPHNSRQTITAAPGDIGPQHYRPLITYATALARLSASGPINVRYAAAFMRPLNRDAFRADFVAVRRRLTGDMRPELAWVRWLMRHTIKNLCMFCTPFIDYRAVRQFRLLARADDMATVPNPWIGVASGDLEWLSSDNRIQQGRRRNVQAEALAAAVAAAKGAAVRAETAARAAARRRAPRVRPRNHPSNDARLPRSNGKWLYQISFVSRAAKS